MSRKMIPRDKAEAIRAEYQYLETGDMGLNYPAANDWTHVYAQGSDSKYGTFVYSDSLRAWRGPSFHEFYGGGVVD